MAKSLLIQLIFCLVIASLLPLTGCVRGDEEQQYIDETCEPNIYIEDYEGQTRMLLGIGDGALAASRIRSLYPDRFEVIAGIGGPVSSKGLLTLAQSYLEDFDSWKDDPESVDRLDYLTDLFRHLGNPLYKNADSRFYPPGTEPFDFEKTIPTSYAGFPDRTNPDGSLPVVTFFDANDRIVPFALAVDENQNGQRDAGEPIIVQLHEDIQDLNENGRLDEGEAFFDDGIDGVPNTGDYGEGNGVFDFSPIGQEWIDWDPSVTIPEIAPVDEYNFHNAFYSDIGEESLLDFETTNSELFQSLQDFTSGGTDEFCVENEVGIYDEFFWHNSYPTSLPFVPERFVWMRSPSDDIEFDLENTDAKPFRARRLMQALHYLSSKVPDGLWFEHHDDLPVSFENRSFVSKLGYQIQYSVGLPAGYYSGQWMWRTYPVLYVLPDKGQNPKSWTELLEYSGYLVDATFAQKVIIVILDPNAEAVDGQGYGYFAGPADPREDGLTYDSLFEEIVENVESNFRADEF